jgi:hypothetical protein
MLSFEIVRSVGAALGPVKGAELRSALALQNPTVPFAWVSA